MYNSELYALHQTANNVRTGRLHLDHPKKERLLLAIDNSALFVRNILVNDKTINLDIIEKFKSKIDSSLEILNKGSGRLHNDLRPWNESANLEVLYRIAKKEYKQYEEQTEIHSLPAVRFNLDSLNTFFNKRIEINIHNGFCFPDRTQPLTEKNNVKIFRPLNSNEILLRVSQFTFSSQLLNIDTTDIKQEKHKLLNGIMYENRYYMPIIGQKDLFAKTEMVLNAIK